MLKAHLKRGLPVVVDETNVRQEHVRKMVMEARRYDYRVDLVRLTTPIEVCKQRRDDGVFPLEVIDRMNASLEKDYPAILTMVDDAIETDGMDSVKVVKHQ